MIGIDTNVLICAIAIDDGDQTERARRFIAQGCPGENPCFINSVVFVETAWALQTVHAFNKEDISRVMAKMLGLPELLVQHDSAARLALNLFDKQSVGFSDALIGELNRAAGCSSTATFDRKAARLDGFSRVP
jgi:predicted nucleic-acid-binding protein